MVAKLRGKQKENAKKKINEKKGKGKGKPKGKSREKSKEQKANLEKLNLIREKKTCSICKGTMEFED